MCRVLSFRAQLGNVQTRWQGDIVSCLSSLYPARTTAQVRREHHIIAELKRLVSEMDDRATIAVWDCPSLGGVFRSDPTFSTSSTPFIFKSRSMNTVTHKIPVLMRMRDWKSSQPTWANRASCYVSIPMRHPCSGSANVKMER